MHFWWVVIYKESEIFHIYINESMPLATSPYLKTIFLHYIKLILFINLIFLEGFKEWKFAASYLLLQHTH